MFEIVSSTEVINNELEASLNELLDNYCGYVTDTLLQEEIMDTNKVLMS